MNETYQLGNILQKHGVADPELEKELKTYLDSVVALELRKFAVGYKPYTPYQPYSPWQQPGITWTVNG